MNNRKNQIALYKRLLLFTILFFSAKTTFSIQPAPKISKSSKITYKIISSPVNTWGYDIYVDGKMFVHQPTIPCLPGSVGFNTSQKAIKVAVLVIDKIKHNRMPPTVTIEEMNKIKVL